jgi:DNA-binding NarL/FixJ family response regulator
MDVAHRCAAMPLVQRAREELRAAGARPRRPASTGRDALTPSERRVAERAAIGLTNRQIAQELFVTPRTVEVHLTHVFSKLDIRSRADLPAALSGATRGWEDE